jgi:glucokinase
MSGFVLAGDVGGTKTNLGLFAANVDGVTPVALESFASREHSGLAPVVAAFLARHPARVGAACFGVAGPVIDNRSRTPNLAWEIDGDRLATETGLPSAALINDLVATALGLPALRPDELAVVHPGVPGVPGTPEPVGNQVLLAAGTGLGMAFLPWVNGRRVPVASEGGHVDFAPRAEEEIGLLRHLRERFGRVSVERVLSGPGLVNVYGYLRDVHHLAESPAVREAMARGEDAAHVIGEAALAASTACPLCAKALAIFVGVYGATAGNLALLGTATGGVFLGGGIAPKILPRLTDGLFVESFLAKGRFAPFLERIPVRVILNDRTALLGAARHAAELLSAGIS